MQRQGEIMNRMIAIALAVSVAGCSASRPVEPCSTAPVVSSVMQQRNANVGRTNGPHASVIGIMSIGPAGMGTQGTLACFGELAFADGRSAVGAIDVVNYGTNWPRVEWHPRALTR